MTRLSEHFDSSEFACKDGTPVPDAAIPALKELCIHILEPLRRKYGRCRVNSGYRTRSYNGKIGGARYSQHVYDDDPKSVAVDVTFERGTPTAWARSARWRFRTKRVWNGLSSLQWRRARGKRGGVGTYVHQNFVHLDSGSRRDWAG